MPLRQGLILARDLLYIESGSETDRLVLKGPLGFSILCIRRKNLRGEVFI